MDVNRNIHLDLDAFTATVYLLLRLPPDYTVFCFREGVHTLQRQVLQPELKDNLCPSLSGILPGQAPPAGAMQLLPKRPILEKSNGAAATVFNPNMFHYQQALANMQLQQPAFIPAGEALHSLAILKPSPDSVCHTCLRYGGIMTP